VLDNSLKTGLTISDFIYNYFANWNMLNCRKSVVYLLVIGPQTNKNVFKEIQLLVCFNLWPTTL